MADLPPITGLRADIVPHSLWAISKWFYANPIWYYYRRGTDESKKTDRKFYELVDRELRELCKLLYDHGLHTTPSCQGHFYPKDRFKNIWRELTRESAAICGDGLVVKDSETDEHFLFREPDYRLAWRDFDEFYDDAGDHQGTGYLGILLPCDCEEVVERLRRLECDEPRLRMFFDEKNGRLLGGRLFSIIVLPRTDEERHDLWAGVTTRFGEILSEHACPAPFVPVARRA
jgi:hypothetical protein